MSDSPTRQRRLDARRSRSALLRAAGELLQTGTAFTLSDVAAQAGVSTATAYRHFQSADSVADIYVAGFLDDVEERVRVSTAQSLPPGERLDPLCEMWVEAVLDWGSALTRLRSPSGFLSRYLRGDDDMVRSIAFIEPVLRSITGVKSAEDERNLYSLSVWNALADPRELLDQHHSLGWSSQTISQRLARAVRGAL